MTDDLRNATAGFLRFEPGHMWLAGAGPGDPGLLTLHTLAGLADADVIVHDALMDERALQKLLDLAACVPETVG
ncbi:MAG TPA: SAM-dependent methyltransferase [Methyloceanibacter sp.]|nr:SAM-dependent methyltransferase [Methyloceanibacter sp.]